MSEDLRRYREAWAAHAAATDHLMRIFHVLASTREEDRAALRDALASAQREYEASRGALADALRDARPPSRGRRPA